MTPDTTQITIPCIICHRQVKTGVTPQEWNDHIKSGKYIQDSFPSLPAGIREMFLSRICSTCWDKMYDELKKEYK